MTLAAWLHLLKHEDARRTEGVLQIQATLLEVLFLRYVQNMCSYGDDTCLRVYLV
jgi:hypothetical protein